LSTPPQRVERADDQGLVELKGRETYGAKRIVAVNFQKRAKIGVYIFNSIQSRNGTFITSDKNSIPYKNQIFFSGGRKIHVIMNRVGV
jgi:hypothetical protein